jgi:hypothetical protein
MGGRRKPELTVVPEGGKPAVELMWTSSGLPATLHAELDGRFHFSALGWPVERTGPDHFRVPVYDAGARPVFSFDLPAPPVSQAYREVYADLRGVGPRYTANVTGRPLEIDVRDMVAILTVCGWTCTPPRVREGQRVADRLLWEAPDGLGDQGYVARWARPKREG